MAASFTTKQANFVTKYASLAQQFLTVVDALGLANAEFADDAYGSGGANALTDAIVETVLPAATATTFDSAQASVVTCLQAVASVRSALEILRP